MWNLERSVSNEHIEPLSSIVASELNSIINRLHIFLILLFTYAHHLFFLGTYTFSEIHVSELSGYSYDFNSVCSDRAKITGSCSDVSHMNIVESLSK